MSCLQAVVKPWRECPIPVPLGNAGFHLTRCAMQDPISIHDPEVSDHGHQGTGLQAPRTERISPDFPWPGGVVLLVVYRTVWLGGAVRGFCASKAQPAGMSCPVCNGDTTAAFAMVAAAHMARAIFVVLPGGGWMRERCMRISCGRWA